jgi:hypothetical protein
LLLIAHAFILWSDNSGKTVKSGKIHGKFSKCFVGTFPVKRFDSEMKNLRIFNFAK